MISKLIIESHLSVCGSMLMYSQFKPIFTMNGNSNHSIVVVIYFYFARLIVNNIPLTMEIIFCCHR